MTSAEARGDRSISMLSAARVLVVLSLAHTVLSVLQRHGLSEGANWSWPDDLVIADRRALS